MKPPANNPLLFLTPQERLYVHMRRLGLNRTDVARAFDTNENQVSAWLRGVGEDPTIPEVPLQEPIEWHEILGIARRRLRVSIKDMSNMMGVAHVTLILRERGEGDMAPFIEWWENMGWPLPFQISSSSSKHEVFRTRALGPVEGRDDTLY